MWFFVLSVALAGPVSAGSGHSCAGLGGAVLCWGGLSAAEGRAGEPPPRPLPYRVDGISTAASLDAGGATRTCAVTEARRVMCWSLDAPPVDVGLTDARQVSVGDRHACALRGAGEVWCWGDNHRGQLGDGSLQPRTEPVRVPGLDEAVQLSAGWYHSCATLRGGRVWCWGDTSHGQLGDGRQAEPSTEPTPALHLEDAVEVHAGQFHTCALRRNGYVTCWGSNLSGQLGDGTRDSSPVVTRVRGIDDAVALSVGMDFACAVRSGGRLTCWGSNERGQLGNPDSKDALLPRWVEGLSAASVSCGDMHTCATDLRGQPWCWGQNFSGQLGDGLRGTRRAPGRVELVP